MRPITILRAAAWVAVAVVGWALNVRWGADVRLGPGPPAMWQRHVVGALMLAMVTAMSVSVSGRGHRPPAWIARGIALAAALGVVWLAIAIRRGAPPSAIGGPGWSWLLTGALLAASAAAVSFALGGARTDDAPAPRSRRRRARGR
jgi:hypothetical protein